ncbi:MAG: hypothetical protein LBJ39_06400, partial [Tannerellaceae bacterium]|nr:hypothetical protein [Tannerellaceae bacterium]
MKNILLLAFTLAILAQASAQTSGRIPLAALFERIEEQTDYRIFCLPQHSDTLTVNIPDATLDPVEQLRQALVETSLKVSVYRHDIMITKDVAMQTTLPIGYFNPPAYRAEETSAPLAAGSAQTAPADRDVAREYELKEVTVMSGRSENVRTAAIGVQRLEAKAIKNIPTVFGEKDILRIVSALPGVKTAGEVSGGFNVR